MGQFKRAEVVNSWRAPRVWKIVLRICRSKDLPLKQSGEEGPSERKRPRNRTPLFKLSAVLPEFAAETRRILIKWGQTALANQVDDLWIYDRCRCGGKECATVDTSEVDPWKAGHQTIGGRFTETGFLVVDTFDEHIVCIEMLWYPEFVKALTELLP